MVPLPYIQNEGLFMVNSVHVIIVARPLLDVVNIIVSFLVLRLERQDMRLDLWPSC
jgi:hypothetical protein